ncbi:LapA family protein [Wansuia hejianensis]|uniref:DUF1049 domain-containing protein n=1 Tax=Wansuia hejianensis TaxID=2763667 RepID=A0A926ILY9_9FIRM|nr:lipopolysaccharide assembly protein LapA domain-containing protein [Wansuia hejianensis]MBC8589875.1 DUF1049 domain-containing protein [Wansuia hejianensis]
MKINMEFKLIMSLIFAVIVAIFAIQNAGNVEINFLFGKFTISQAVIILGSAVVGALSIFLIGLVKQIKQSKKIKDLNYKIKTLMDEKEALKNKVDNLIISKEQIHSIEPVESIDSADEIEYKE